MRSKEYPTSLIAWERLNEEFILNSKWLKACSKGGALYVYDLVVNIEHPILDSTLDFGRLFNYTKAKWSQLVKNYVDKEALSQVAEEVKTEEGKNNKCYNIALAFTNNHKHGKSCLLSMVFSRRVGRSKPNVTVFLRASEVTKRLLCDLLLFQRMGEYVYGDTEFTLTIHFNQIFNDDVVLLMYQAHKDIKGILNSRRKTERSVYMGKLLDDFLSKNPQNVKYKIHRRVVKVLRPDLMKYPTTLVKDCIL